MLTLYCIKLLSPIDINLPNLIKIELVDFGDLNMDMQTLLIKKIIMVFA